MDKRNLFFWSLSISPYGSFATLLHLEAPPENIEKIDKYWLSNIELVLTHSILELGVLSIARKLSVFLHFKLCFENLIPSYVLSV